MDAVPTLSLTEPRMDVHHKPKKERPYVSMALKGGGGKRTKGENRRDARNEPGSSDERNDSIRRRNTGEKRDSSTRRIDVPMWSKKETRKELVVSMCRKRL